MAMKTYQDAYAELRLATNPDQEVKLTHDEILLQATMNRESAADLITAMELCKVDTQYTAADGRFELSERLKAIQMTLTAALAEVGR